MSENALDRLLNSDTRNQKEAKHESIEDQLNDAVASDDDFIIDGMSTSAKNALYEKVKEEEQKKKPRPVSLDDIDEKEDIITVDRPDDKPISEKDEKAISNIMEDTEDLIETQPKKSKRGRKPKNMEEQKDSKNKYDSIINQLSTMAIDDLIKSSYKFRDFSKADSKLILEYILTKLKGE